VRQPACTSNVRRDGRIFFAFGKKQSTHFTLKENEIEKEIRAYRKAKGPRKP